MTRNLFCIVILALCLLVLASPVKADDVEFEIFSTDSTHGGTADTYYAEIGIWGDGITKVRLHDGSDWTDFYKEGFGEFWLETNAFTNLGTLIADIEGAGQKLEITHGAGVSVYSFTIKGGASAELTAIEAKMPAPTPIITSVVPIGPQEQRLSWTWGGDIADVTCLCAGAEAKVGGIWEDVCDKCSDDDPAEIDITDLSVDIDFSGHPGPYQEIVYWAGYGNLNDISGGAGTLISGWTLDSGDELFDGVDDEVLEVFEAEGFVVIPEPMTLSLLAIGGLAVLIRRKR